MKLFLGVDVGGTRTRALLANDEGVELGRGQALGGNPVRVGLEHAAARIRSAVKGAVEGQGALRLDGLCVGLSGVSHPQAVEMVRDALSLWDPLPRARCLVGDLRIAFESAFPGGPGVLVLSGTGSGGFARSETRIHHLGGLGPQLGDEGSGYVLVLSALRAVAAAEEGRAPRTRLRDPLFQALEVAHYRELPSRVAEGVPLAEFFPVLGEIALAGDGVAIALLESGGKELSSLARAAARAAGLNGGRIATAGGVLGGSEILRNSLISGLEEGPEQFLMGPHVENPVEGALWMAQRLAEGKLESTGLRYRF